MAVTIQEIAKTAGVSPGTVSRILNGGNKENRPSAVERAEHVRRVASTLGYRPNVAARSMTTGRFQTVAFVSCGEVGFDWFSHLLLHGIHQRLEDRSYRLVMNELTIRELTDTQALPWLFREQVVDAILLHIDSKIDDALRIFQKSHPGRVVLLNEELPRDSVYPEERMGGRIAAQHLIREGHRSIGYFALFAPDVPLHFSVQRRLEGVQECLRDAELDDSSFRIRDEQFHTPIGDGAMRAKAFLEEYSHLSAVVCYSLKEYMLMRVAAAMLGRRVPNDLKLIVFHDEPAHYPSDMPTDTVIIPFAEMGNRAVSMVFDLLDERSNTLPGRAVPYREIYDASIARVTVAETGVK
ncbi:MAG: LacI family DNA-binding transcriptional regulator [Planctomycetota bacterium]